MAPAKIEGAKSERGSAYIFKGNDLRDLKISLNVGRWHPRGKQTDGERVLELAKEMSNPDIGQITRIVVRKCEEKREGEITTYFEVIEGRHRTDAAKLILAEPAMFDMTEKEAELFPLRASLVRADDAKAMLYGQKGNEGLPVGPMDYLKIAKAWRDLFNHTQHEVAEKMGKTQSRISKILQLDKLSMPLKIALHQKRIPEGLCAAIVAPKMFTEEEIRTMGARIQNKEMSIQELKGEVNARKKELKRLKNPDSAEKPTLIDVFGMLRKAGTTRAKVFIGFFDADPAVNEELFLSLFDDNPEAFKVIADRQREEREEREERERELKELEQEEAEKQNKLKAADEEALALESRDNDDDDDDGGESEQVVTSEELAEIQAQDEHSGHLGLV